MGDEDGVMAVSWRPRQEERWEMENNGIKVFSIVRVGALSGEVKESDEHVVMLNDDMMNPGGTLQSRVQNTGFFSFRFSRFHPVIIKQTDSSLKVFYTKNEKIKKLIYGIIMKIFLNCCKKATQVRRTKRFMVIIVKHLNFID